MSKILITGSDGTIGTVLRQGLVDYDIRPFDRPEFDVRTYKQLTNQLLGCIAVVHLAWNTKTEHFKSNLTDPDNLIMAKNVYNAAREVGVRRVIIASSIHADMPGPRANNRSPYATPQPDSPYGHTKVAIEKLGREYASRNELEVVCIRFGWVSSNPEARPSPNKPYPADEGWLSHNDCVRLVRTCIEAPEIPDNYQIIWGLSRRENGGVHDLSNPLWRPADLYRAPLPHRT